MKKLTFKDLKETYGYSSWYCDAKNYEPCPRDEKNENNDLYEALYHKKLSEGDYK